LPSAEVSWASAVRLDSETKRGTHRKYFRRKYLLMLPLADEGGLELLVGGCRVANLSLVRVQSIG